MGCCPAPGDANRPTLAVLENPVMQHSIITHIPTHKPKIHGLYLPDFFASAQARGGGYARAWARHTPTPRKSRLFRFVYPVSPRRRKKFPDRGQRKTRRKPHVVGGRDSIFFAPALGVRVCPSRGRVCAQPLCGIAPTPRKEKSMFRFPAAPTYHHAKNFPHEEFYKIPHRCGISAERRTT